MLPFGDENMSVASRGDYLPLLLNSNYAPDINITHIDGYTDNNAEYNLPINFWYANDGNLTITFQVQDLNQNDLNFNMWYSATAGGRDNVIVSDLNLTDTYCDNNNFDVTTQCSYDFNIFWDLIGDGNYFIDVVVSDGMTTDSNSSSTFRIENVATVDFNFFVGTSYPFDLNFIKMDANVDWYDAVDVNSPYTIDMNKSNYDINFYKNGWDSNLNNLVVLDGNVDILIYLDKFVYPRRRYFSLMGNEVFPFVAMAEMDSKRNLFTKHLLMNRCNMIYQVRVHVCK